MTRANGMGALPTLFQTRAGAMTLLKIFEAEKLPLAVVGTPQTPVPRGSMVGLFDRCAWHLGDRTFAPDLGYDIIPNGPFGIWAQYGATAPTLGEALHRLSATDASISQAA